MRKQVLNSLTEVKSETSCVQKLYMDCVKLSRFALEPLTLNIRNKIIKAT